ncbi:MAG: O-antigen ligase family protein [Planctomycetota bacterium]
MTKFGILCDKFLEACWLAALVLSPLYMNIYTHRMFEPDKGTIIRSLALLMIVFYLIKLMETAKTAAPLRDKPAPAPASRCPTGSGRSVSEGIGAGKPSKQAAEKTAEVTSPPRRNYILLTFLAFITFYIVSVIFSAVPYNSLWGGYDRMQGLYTNGSFWVIFILAAINIKTREQAERLISAIIFTSVPIVAYCFIQRLRLDPVPWQAMDPSIRVSATMGNPIFLSAYLIITIPLTISRFVRNLYENNMVSYTLYGLLVFLQVITVFLSQSRGPMMGMFGGIFLFILIYAWAYRKRKLLWGIISASVIGLIFLFLFNLSHIVKFQNPPDTVGGYGAMPSSTLPPGGNTNTAKAPISTTAVGPMEALWHKTFGKLMNIQYLRQFGRLLERDQHSSGRTRIILWKGVWKLITDKDERYRFFIGYGPESLSTVYYKNYTMELASLEGSNVHADRTHNHYLDVWVMHGLLGLIAYLAMLAAIFYTAYKTIRSIRGTHDASTTGPPSTDILIMIGLITALVAHLGEIFVGIAIVSTYTHFWLITATIYAIYRFNILSDAGNNKTEASPLPEPSGFSAVPLRRDGGHWGVYLLLGYAALTIIIAFILFYLSWDDTKMITPDMKSTRDALLATFCIWLLAGIIVGIVAWPRYLFWTYAGQTVMMAVIMVKRYWPDDTSDTDLLMIYSWFWILEGIIVGALSLPRKEKTIRFWTFSNVLAGLVISTVVVVIIANKNLTVLRADGFYKFCFSYDQSAEEVIRTGDRNAEKAMQAGKQDEALQIRQAKREESFQIRLMCIGHFQNALKFSPDERAYLNGAGRNFLELAKLASMRNQGNNTTTPDKLRNVPSIKELVEGDFVKRDASNRPYTDYSFHDFAVCSFSCIQRAYELDPKNYERIIALVRIYRYLGDMDRDIAKIDRALKLCAEALKASPLNTKTNEEIRELQQRKTAFSAPPPAEHKPK